MPLSSPNLHAVGLDIGGTNIKFVVLDKNLKTVTRGSRPSQAQKSPAEVVAVAHRILADLKGDGYHFDTVGVGCAGSVDPKRGVVRTSPNFSGWKNVSLGDLVARGAGARVLVENDANCAAWGEWMLGASKRASHLMVLTLGTGIGGGIVADDRIFRGSTSTGPELGHFSIHYDGPVCSCGLNGCFEYYCSGTAFHRDTNFSAREFFERLGSSLPCQVYLEAYVQRLAVGMASLANLFDPELILLAGGVAVGLKPSIEPLNARVKALCFPSIAENLKIELSELDEFSGAIGAALLEKEARSHSDR